MKRFVVLVLMAAAAHAADAPKPPTAPEAPARPQGGNEAPRIERGPFGDVTVRPGTPPAAESKESGFVLVTGALAEEPVQGFATNPALAGGKLAYIVYSTLRSPAEAPAAAPPATAKLPAKSPAPRLVKHPYLVLKEFGPQGETLKQQIFQINWSFFRPTALYWFPGGSKLLLQADDASRGPNNTALYTWEIGASYPKAVLVPRAYQRIAISPNGRYVAASAFGAYVNGRWDSQAAVQLVLHDLETGKGRDIGKERVATSLAWTPDNKLLYSLLPPKEAGGFRAAVQGDLFELDPASPPETEPNQVGRGMAPQPSPDGRWVALLGQRDPIKEPIFVMPFVCLLERATGKRYVGPDSVRECYWTPDSGRLLLLGQGQVAGAPLLTLRAVNLAASKTEEIGNLPLDTQLYLSANLATAAPKAASTAPSVNPVANSPVAPAAKATTATSTPAHPARWDPINTTKDGGQLLLWIRAWLPPNERGLSEEAWTLQTLDTHNGAATSQGTIKSAIAAAWWMAK